MLGGAGALLLSCTALAMPGSAQSTNVTTYHYDNGRTGWNSNEQTLTPANVAGGTFGILHTGTLNGVTNSQPVLATNVTIPNKGVHNVLYVITDKNYVYGIDASSGAGLLKQSMGATPPKTAIPNNSQVGILSTPVIDLSTSTIYLIATTYEDLGQGKVVVYRLHALDLGTLTDKVPSEIVSGSNTLSDGSTINFTASIERQRPALLEANGNIYAGFGSFGDVKDAQSRGWLLGWNAATLAPLPANILANHFATSPPNCARAASCFLTSIWMSGFGVAADPSGNLYFVTGNSDRGTYVPPNNIQESALNVTGDLTSIADIFTPWQVDTWDRQDTDFGSGGLTLLPPQPGSIPNLAVAAGKAGTMYLMNRDNLGGHVTSPPDNVLAEVSIGPCWCGQSYFTGADGVGRVVSSGGDTVQVWKVVTSPSVSLALESQSAVLATGGDGGFFTTVSSSGNLAQNGIIWALARASVVNGPLTLYAFNAADSTTLTSISVGSWPYSNANPNVVPVVANGNVYIAAGRGWAILGLAAKPGASVPKDTVVEPRTPGHEIYGKVVSVNGWNIGLRTRTGRIVSVDSGPAAKADLAVDAFVGRALVINGTYDAAGVMHARLIQRAKDSPALWLSDK